MDDDLKKIENFLGGSFEISSSRSIPGTEDIDTRKAIYFSDDGKNTIAKQFKKITCFTNPPFATAGGVNEAGCQITPPDGPTFHGTVLHGDIEGWTKDIEAGGNGLRLLLARIDGDQFSISDGRRFSLTDCKIKFT
jgi:hypothetical protein